MAEQQNWLWCNKCQELVHGAASGACAAGGVHDNTGSSYYVMPTDAPAGVQSQGDWRWCNKCHAMFYAGSGVAPAACPGGQNHDFTGSAAYFLATSAYPAGSGQSNWRWCDKCHAIFYAGPGVDGGHCSANSGGAHSAAGATYSMKLGTAPAPIDYGYGTYRIEVRSTGKLLTVDDDGTSNGTSITQWDDDRGRDSGLHQQFYFMPCDEPGPDASTDPTSARCYYYIVGARSGLFVDTNDAGTDNGVWVRTWEYEPTRENADWQKWYLEPVPNEPSWFHLRNKLSGRRVTIHDDGRNNGSGVVIWDPDDGRNNGDHQKFRFLQATALNLPQLSVQQTPVYPTLTSRAPAVDESSTFFARTVWVPFYLVNDPQGGAAWQVTHSPFYAMTRTARFVLLKFYNNESSITQSEKLSVATGISQTETDTISNTWGVRLTMSYSPPSATGGAGFSAELSFQLQITRTTSTETSTLKTDEYPLIVPPNTAVALYVIQSQFTLARRDTSPVTNDSFPGTWSVNEGGDASIFTTQYPPAT